jgi:hypothetical protein
VKLPGFFFPSISMIAESGDSIGTCGGRAS